MLGPIRRERIGNATGGPQGARQGWRATILMYFTIRLLVPSLGLAPSGLALRFAPGETRPRFAPDAFFTS
ncbi:MAG: hypothetical protein ACREX4_07700, partial [Gammaproteobacteria bacterium]